jgi:hypothetical protein
MTEPGIGAVHTELLEKELCPSQKKMLSFEDQCKYKYILHIDGFTAAWRLCRELFSRSVILKVDSEWVEHYYDKLIPWKHYIPIKSDLSDLIQRIEWCRINDKICEEIADNAYLFAKENFTKEKMIDYVFDAITKTSHNICDRSISYDYKFDISLQSLPKVLNDVKFDNIKYVRTLLPNILMSYRCEKYWRYEDFLGFCDTLTMYKSLRDNEYSKKVDKLISNAYNYKLVGCNFNGEKVVPNLIKTEKTLTELVNCINDKYISIKFIFCKEIQDETQRFIDGSYGEKISKADRIYDFCNASMINYNHDNNIKIFVDAVNIKDDTIVHHFVKLDNAVDVVSLYADILKNRSLNIHMKEIKIRISSPGFYNDLSEYNKLSCNFPTDD